MVNQKKVLKVALLQGVLVLLKTIKKSSLKSYKFAAKYLILMMKIKTWKKKKLDFKLYKSFRI